MFKRITAIALALVIVAAGAGTVFASDPNKVFEMDVRSGETKNGSVAAFDNYTTSTEVSNKNLDAGNVTINLSLGGIEWLGIDEQRTGTIITKTGASPVDINSKLSNLRVFSINEEIRTSSLVGYTFGCKNIGTWDTSSGTGHWVTDYNTPETNIKKVLDKLTDDEYGYLESEYVENSRCDDLPEQGFMDNKISIPKGTRLQFGNSVIEFLQKYEINDLYDQVGAYALYKLNEYNRAVFAEERPRKDLYASDFAKAVYGLNEAISIKESDESKIEIYIPKKGMLQAANTRITNWRPIDITVDSENKVTSDPLKEFVKALGTAKTIETGFYEITRDPYYEYSCDADAVVDSGLGVLNEVIGVLAGKGVKIELVCEHDETRIINDKAATVLEEGYTGDTQCCLCDKIIKIGEPVAKLEPSIGISPASVTLQKGQAFSGITVTYGEGDSIASVVSSDDAIVTGETSGDSNIRLKAGSTVGTANVTVTLASGISADIAVNVQKSAVACTGLKITSGTSVKLKKGKKHTIKAVRTPVTCVQKITYKTSNKKVATVTSKGVVKGVKKGTAKITVKCGKKSKTVKVKVS